MPDKKQQQKFYSIFCTKHTKDCLDVVRIYFKAYHGIRLQRRQAAGYVIHHFPLIKGQRINFPVKHGNLSLPGMNVTLEEEAVRRLKKIAAQLSVSRELALTVAAGVIAAQLAREMLATPPKNYAAEVRVKVRYKFPRNLKELAQYEGIEAE